MIIKSIEPTPSPNVMKLNMSESLPEGVSRNYTKHKRENAPDYIGKLLDIEGVQGVFQVKDFIALERHPKAAWEDILAQAAIVFGDDSAIKSMKETRATTFGEVQVLVQKFHGIPMQVKLIAGADEMRFGLPDRFGKAVMQVQAASNNLLVERHWEDQGVRYGTFKEIGDEVVAELSASYDEARLQALVRQVTGEGVGEAPEQTISGEEAALLMEHPDWEKRFAALERIDPTEEDIPMLERALDDPQLSIRRLAAVYLGMIGKKALPALYKALKDKSPAVRRTAGDAINDIGDPSATAAMAEALSDPNKLVRWRAARFLYEVGDESAIPALLKAQDDPEFEVSLQARMALERLERGEEASGTVWQQMARSRGRLEE